MRKVALLFVAVISMAVLPTTAFSAATPDEQWFAPTDRSRGGLVGFDYSEGFEFQRITTSMTPVYPKGYQVLNDGNSKFATTCNGVKDPACSAAVSFGYHAVFPVCSEERNKDCIESLWAEINGEKILGKYLENIPAQPTTPYSDDGAVNLITGSTPSVWQIPGVIHGGGKDTYVVNSLIGQAADSATVPVPFKSGGKFSFAINPVTLISGNYPAAVAGKPWPVDIDEYRVCATYGDNRCALKHAFPKDTRFGVSIRMSQPPIGWLHGRFKAPIAAIEQVSGGTRVSISGDPIQVPAVAGNFPLADYPAEFQKSHLEENGYILMLGKGGTVSGYGYFMQGNNPPNTVYQPGLSGTTFGLKSILTMVKDKSAAEPTTWRVSTLSYFEDNQVAMCVNRGNKLAGIVSTNSTTYSEGPPTLDPTTKSLDYVLASAHYTSKGEEFLGTYDLLLDASVARCIYGFAKTPTSATVSIVKDGEVEKVSTTTITEKDGWLSMAAYGFTFSSPKISVKLIQAKEESVVKGEQSVTQENSTTKVETVQPSTPQIKKVQTRSITCTKGANKKTIKGVNPKCPKGYKLVK